MSIHKITGGGGLRMAVHEYGSPEGKPIVLIHGINQCSLVWHRQYRSSLAEEFRVVCLDIRGHGMSEKPAVPERYTQADLWADDGTKSTNMIGKDFIKTGPGLCSDNLEDNIQALRELVRVLFNKPPSQEDREVLIASGMVVPPAVRLGMLSRTIDRDTVMQQLKVPVLITRGEVDAVLMPAHTEHLLACIPNAEASLYEGIGHSPPLEAPEQFNRELTKFARQYAG